MAAKPCNICNIRRPMTGTGPGVDVSGDTTMCNLCYTEGGWENDHEDNGHITAVSLLDMENPAIVAKLEEAKGCWICHPALNLAQKPRKVQDQRNSSVAGFTRRPQFNHKGHSHPQTPAARRACKNAFWAAVADVENAKTDYEVAKAMGVWDFQCDGFGKETKAATWHVAPKGKTRSVQSTGK